MFLFSLENLTVSNLNVNFSLTYLFVSSRIASERSAIVSQLSKIFCRFTSTPFLFGSAKVRAFLFLPNFSRIILKNFRIFWRENQTVLKRTRSFFSERAAKVRDSKFPTNFSCKFCSHYFHFFAPYRHQLTDHFRWSKILLLINEL